MAVIGVISKNSSQPKTAPVASGSANVIPVLTKSKPAPVSKEQKALNTVNRAFNVIGSIKQQYKQPRTVIDLSDKTPKSIFNNFEKLAGDLGRVLQKTPNLDLGTKTKGLISFGRVGVNKNADRDTEIKITNFISNMPSSFLQSWGQTIEQLSTEEGRERAKQDAINLPKTMGEVKTAIDNRDWQKAYEVAMSNSAITIALDVSDFIPASFLAKLGLKPLKALTKERALAKKIVTEAIEETEEQAVKTIVKPKTVEVKPEPKPEIKEKVSENVKTEAEAELDWEKNYAPKVEELEAKTQKLREEIKTSKASERPALEAEKAKIDKESADLEEEFLNKYGKIDVEPNVAKPLLSDIPKELEPLAKNVGKYDTAEDFVKAHSANSLLDLSNPQQHRFGRIFDQAEDGKIMDTVDTVKQYAQDIRYHPDAKVPMVSSGDDLVTIYRGTTKKQGEILPGDFVSFSEDYARSHNNGENLLKLEVPAKDVIWQGNDFSEWIYSPSKIRAQFTDLTDVYNKAKSSSPLPQGAGKPKLLKDADTIPVEKSPKQTVKEELITKETTKKPAYSSKEAKAVQETFSNELVRINANASNQKELIEQATKVIDETVEKLKGDRVGLAGLRTSINKEMFEFVGLGGKSYQQAYAELKLMLDDPEIGDYLRALEDKKAEIDELIKTTPETTKVVTKTTEKRVTEQVIPQPIGKGESKISKLSAGVEAKAVEKKLTDSLGTLREFKQVNIPEQAQLATNLLNKDIEKAIDIALGKRTPPANILPEAVFTAVENHALKTNDLSLIQRLATSVRTTEATAMGQRIRLLAERNNDSAVSIISDVIKARQEAFEARFKGKTTKEVTEKVIGDIKKKVKVPDKYDWNNFVESIQC